jgi:hypothetical protein
MTADWFDDIYVEDDQRDLLAWMVESERSLAREQRNSFLLVQTQSGAFLIHPHVPERPAIVKGDLESLADAQLLRRGFGSGGDPLYDVTPLGRRFYAEHRIRAGEAITAVEEEIHRFISAPGFAEAFPTAYQLWRDAANELWGADDLSQFTRIGHLCREAMQAFATTLADRAGIPTPASEAPRTIERIRAVLDKAALGDADRAFLAALVSYWGTVSDLVQRLEHGAAKEGKALTWEDARRVAFQTALAMFEISRSVA